MRADRWDLVHKETGTRSDLFSVLCEHEVRRSLRHRDFFTLLMLELDRRLQASETLETLTALMEKDIRETDLGAHIGGRRFAVLLPGCDLDAAHMVASRILGHVSKHVFPHAEGQHLTASIGGYVFPRLQHHWRYLIFSRKLRML